MADESRAETFTNEICKRSGKRCTEERTRRSRTLLLSTRQAGPRIKFLTKGNEDDSGPRNCHLITSRSSELKQTREFGPQRQKASLSTSRRTSFGSFSSHRAPQKPLSRASSSRLSSKTASLTQQALSPIRALAPQVTESGSASKIEGTQRNRERRSKSLVAHEPGRRRSSGLLSSPNAVHFSPREMMLQESKSSSRDSDGSRGWPSVTCALGRSVSDLVSRPKTRRNFGSRREGSLRSPVRSPQSNRFRITKFELAMAQQEEHTLEQMRKLKSNCSGSETEALSMKGIVSSLIAIENEEV